jgi:hypothetical protein
MHMMHIIHARRLGSGEFRFRIWSNVVGSYISNEMTEAELRVWTLRDAVDIAITEHSQAIDATIQRTIQNGTSSLLDNNLRDLNASWDKQPA